LAGSCASRLHRNADSSVEIGRGEIDLLFARRRRGYRRDGNVEGWQAVGLTYARLNRIASVLARSHSAVATAQNSQAAGRRPAGF